jgi:hypothetical protein
MEAGAHSQDAVGGGAAQVQRAAGDRVHAVAEQRVQRRQERRLALLQVE